MVTPQTDINPDPDTEEEESNIKARKVRKLIIIVCIGQNHNNSGKIYTTGILLSRPCTDTKKNLLCKK